MSVKTIPKRLSALPPRLATVTSRNVRTRNAQWYRDVAELKRQQPFCVLCIRAGAKQPMVATQTDHVVPLVQGGTNDVNNLQRVCDACHEAKTDVENDRRYVY